jgi:four helix bundle protein
MFGFERLEVWQRSLEFSRKVYTVTRQFPPEERFGLTNQLRRSSVSISANVAEGSGRHSHREFAHFVAIAYGSIMETVSHLRIAKTLTFLNDQEFEDLYLQAEEIARMLSGLRHSLLQSTNRH